MDTQWTLGLVARLARNFLPRTQRTLCAHCVENLFFSVPMVLIVATGPAIAQDDAFSDTRDGGKLHAASGFVCPPKIGLFERDAVGEADPATGADFCAYSALDGVYGTIKLTMLNGPYNAQASLAPGFTEEEDTGAKRIGEGMLSIASKPSSQPLAVYTRTYETQQLEDRHYRVLFAGTQIRNWAVETTIEYTDPNDLAVESEFLRAVFAAAGAQIAGK